MQVLRREGKQACRLAEVKLQSAGETLVTSDQVAHSLLQQHKWQPTEAIHLAAAGRVGGPCRALKLFVAAQYRGSFSQPLKLAAAPDRLHRQRTKADSN